MFTARASPSAEGKPIEPRVPEIGDRVLPCYVMAFLRRGTLGTVALLVALQPAAARAQTAEQRAGARAAATEGFHEFQQGHWQKAIDLFTRAQRLVDAPTQVLFIARANAKLGHYVKARELYLQITHESLAANAPAAFRRAQESAAEEVKDVSTKIAHLTINVSGAGDATVIVTMDGAPVPPALVGIDMPVDPGAHRIKAAASGFKPAEQDVKLALGASQTLALKLASVPSAGGAPASLKASPYATSTPSSPASSDQGASAGGSNGLRIGSYAALGVGVVGIGIGTFFVLRSSGKRNDADTAFKACGSPCLDSNPNASKVASLDDSARSAQTLATVSYIVGGVGVAAGVTLWLLSNKSHDSEHASAPLIQPWIGMESAGVTGSF
jgi:hypothetical protein